MQPSVIKIAETKYNVPELLKAAQKVLDVDLGKPLYSSGQDVNKASNAVVLLNSIRDENAQPITVLDNPGHLRYHFFFSFLVACDQRSLLALAAESEIRIQYTETAQYQFFAVCSGSLAHWYAAITNLSSPASSTDLRAVLNRVQSILEMDGFRFTQWGKISLSDGTFKLIEKS